jgi:hypothetical protein
MVMCPDNATGYITGMAVRVYIDKLGGKIRVFGRSRGEKMEFQRAGDLNIFFKLRRRIAQYVIAPFNKVLISVFRLVYYWLPACELF